MFICVTKIVYVMGLAMINTISHRVTKCGRNLGRNLWKFPHLDYYFIKKMNTKMLIERGIEAGIPITFKEYLHFYLLSLNCRSPPRFNISKDASTDISQLRPTV